MGELTESSQWIEDIYRIQKTDPVLGGQDGIINVQPEQIASRTLYLRDLLELQHKPDGSHSVTDEQIADNAAIPEANLVLDIPTQQLANLARVTKTDTKVLEKQVNTVLGENGFLVNGLARTATLGWRYGQWGCEFEFFEDRLTMRDVRNMDARSIVVKDDSIDCDDNSGMAPGMRLLVSDGVNREEVEIRSVLDRGRIRTVRDLSTDFNEPVTIGYTDWDISQESGALVYKDSLYFSRTLEVLNNCAVGLLLICRDVGEGALKVEAREVDSRAPWSVLSLYESYPHEADEERRYDCYKLSGTNVQLKITGLTDTPVAVSHLAVFPDPFNMLASSLRTPNLLLPEAKAPLWREAFGLESSEFLTAYRDYYVQTEYGLFDSDTGALVWSAVIRSNSFTVLEELQELPEAKDYYFRCRHQSDMGEWSGWSEPVLVSLMAERRLFGFLRAPKAFGFDTDSVMEWLGLHPACFGFVGAKASKGFGVEKAHFVKKLED